MAPLRAAEVAAHLPLRHVIDGYLEVAPLEVFSPAPDGRLILTEADFLSNPQTAKPRAID